MNTLSELGEFGLIEKIKELTKQKLPKGFMGIGHDCAVIPRGKKELELVTTDCLVEGVHFLRDKIEPRDLGYKSLAVNLSDIAASGGKPTGFFLTLALPADTSLDWVERFIKGLNELSQITKTPLLGGDTSVSKNGIFINICAIGVVEKKFLRTRALAKPGDHICVTDFLGDSSCGLKLMLRAQNLDKITRDDEKFLLEKHFRPRPELEASAWLIRQKGVHAMMDISDGLAGDIKHIAQESKLGVEIDLEKIPVSPALQNVCSRENWNTLEMGAVGGEDYSLLVTIDKSKVENIRKAFAKKFKRELFDVGQMTKSKEISFLLAGQKTRLENSSHVHFKN